MDTAAALDEEKGELAVFVINRRWDGDTSAELDVSGFGGWRFVEHVRMYSDDLSARNTFENPNAVAPEADPATKFENGKITASLKSLSWNVFRFKR